MSNKTTYNQFTETFYRYINDQMEARERNKFEHSLQIDPFEREALDGFRTIKEKTLLNELKKVNLENNRPPIFTKKTLVILLSILLLALLGFGIVALSKKLKSYNNKKVSTEIHQKETVLIPIEDIGYSTTDSTETIVYDSITTPSTTEENLTNNLQKKEQKPGKKTTKTPANLNNEITAITPIVTISETEKISPNDISATNNATSVLGQTYRGRIVETANAQPINGATIKSKNGNTVISQADGSFSISILPDEYPIFTIGKSGMGSKELIFDKTNNNTVYLDATARTGEDASNQPSPTRSGLSSQAEPFGGQSLFKTYIDNNIRYPREAASQRRETVRVRFKVSLRGDPYDVEVSNSPGDAFTYEAIRLIVEGPRWAPAVKNGVPVVGEASVRITFRP